VQYCYSTPYVLLDIIPFSFFKLQCFAFFVPARLDFARGNNIIRGTRICFIVTSPFMIALLLGGHWHTVRNTIDLSLPNVFNPKGREFKFRRIREEPWRRLSCTRLGGRRSLSVSRVLTNYSGQTRVSRTTNMLLIWVLGRRCQRNTDSDMTCGKSSLMKILGTVRWFVSCERYP